MSKSYKIFLKNKTDCEEARIFLSLSKSVTKHDSINRELSKNHFKASLLTLIKVLWGFKMFHRQLFNLSDGRIEDLLVSFSYGWIFPCIYTIRSRSESEKIFAFLDE